jgi:hypothetical protein
MLVIEIIDDDLSRDWVELDGLWRKNWKVRRVRTIAESLIGRRDEVDHLAAIFLHESYNAPREGKREIEEFCAAQDVPYFLFTGGRGTVRTRGSLYSLAVVRRSLPAVVEELKDRDTQPSARFIRAVIADTLAGQGRVARKVLEVCAAVLRTAALREQWKPGEGASVRQVLTDDLLRQAAGPQNLGDALAAVLRHPRFELPFEQCELASADPLTVLAAFLAAKPVVFCGGGHLIADRCVTRPDLFWLIKCAVDPHEAFDLTRYWAGVADARALLQ